MHRQTSHKSVPKAHKPTHAKKITKAPRTAAKARITTRRVRPSAPIQTSANLTSQHHQPRKIALHTHSTRPFSSGDSGEGQSRQLKMTELITQDFQPTYLKIDDTSGGCGAFYQITVVSTQFEGKMTLARHRAVQTTLKDIIPQIHGLNLFTHTPAQWEQKVASTPPGSV